MKAKSRVKIETTHKVQYEMDPVYLDLLSDFRYRASCTAGVVVGEGDA